MRLKSTCGAIVAAILLTAQAAIAGDLFPKVLVFPITLKPYTDEILRGLATSDSLLRPGQEPHDFALSPNQARALDEADIIILPDLTMNPMLARTIEKKKKLRVIELSKLDGAEALPYAEENPFLTAVKEAVTDQPKKPKKPKPEPERLTKKRERETASVTDPHLWLDPERMAALAVPVATIIADAAPESRPLLTDNARKLARHLTHELMPQLTALLPKQIRTTNAVSQPEIPFITYHAAYQYFLDRFNIDHTGEIVRRPEETIGAKTMSGLINRAEKTRVRCIIGEQETTLMTRVAKATGAKIVLLSPEQLVSRAETDSFEWLQTDYDRLLYKTVKSFASCL